MKKLGFIYLVFLSLGLKANDGAYFGSGNHLIPIHESEISVQKEILKITKIPATKESEHEGMEYVWIDVYYEFFNPKKTTKEVLVGFEAMSPSGDVSGRPVKGRHPYMSDFEVNMNGALLQYTIAYVSDSNYNAVNLLQMDSLKTIIDQRDANWNWNYVDFRYVYHFKARFKPGVNVIKHRYKLALSGSVDIDFQLEYVLTAANRWANQQIDDFTLIIDMKDRSYFMIDETFFKGQNGWKCNGPIEKNPVRLPYMDEGISFQTLGKELVFSQKNFHPEGELNIYRIRYEAFNLDHDFDQKLDSVYHIGDYYLMNWKATNDLSYQVLRNLPYAMRGYAFKNKELKLWFEKQSWYEVDYTYKASREALLPKELEWLNQLEKKYRKTKRSSTPNY